jgi:exodeoxyribonuclease V alpha subunit
MALLDDFFARRLLAKGGVYNEELEKFLAFFFGHMRKGHICLACTPAMQELIKQLPPSLVSEGTSTPLVYQVHQENRLYLQKNWIYETRLLENVKRLYMPLQGPVGWEEKLAAEERLLPEQKQAIQAAMRHSLSVFCGGPGTGKTYTAGFLVRLSGASKLALAAPTGKAASHLEASLRAQGPLDPHLVIQVSTLHRLLKLQPGRTKIPSGFSIDADLVMIDEASMLDLSLLTHLLAAMRPGTRLVLMGDPNQLPPIEGGSLFADLAFLFGTPLKRSMRVEQELMQSFAEAVNRSDVGTVEQILSEGHPTVRKVAREEFPPFEFFETQPDPASCLKKSQQFRVLGTLRQGPQGVDTLNQRLLEQMKAEIRPGQWWAVPILATYNQPSLDLYNGMGGILIGQCRHRFSLGEGVAYFPFQGALRSVPFSSAFEVAFCLSVHKSQGSEFEKVLALFPPGSEVFGKEALYTAITRAKKEIQLCIDSDTLHQCLKSRAQRESGFISRYIEIK